MLCISISIQDCHHRSSSFARRFGSIFDLVLRAKVALREARTEQEHLPSLRTVFNSLASTRHIESCLGHPVLCGLHFIEWTACIEANCDRPAPTCYVDDSWSFVRLVQQRSKCFHHRRRTSDVGTEHLDQFVVIGTRRIRNRGIVDESIQSGVISTNLTTPETLPTDHVSLLPFWLPQ